MDDDSLHEEELDLTGIKNIEDSLDETSEGEDDDGWKDDESGLDLPEEGEEKDEETEKDVGW